MQDFRRDRGEVLRVQCRSEGEVRIVLAEQVPEWVLLLDCFDQQNDGLEHVTRRSAKKRVKLTAFGGKLIGCNN